MRNRTLARRARADLLWSLAAIAALQCGVAVAIEGWLRDVRDPDFAIKMKRLRARLAEAPGRPLVLMLGSSRSQVGLQARRLSETVDHRAIVFNFGLPGSGPMLDLVCLRRLLAAGIRPDLLVLEVAPFDLGTEAGVPMEENRLYKARLSLAEVVALRGYFSRPTRLLREWCAAQCLFSTYQAELRRLLTFDRFKPGRGRSREIPAMDGYGWQPYFLELAEDQRQLFAGLARHQYMRVCGSTCLARQSVWVLRDLLDLCRHEGIRTALLLVPESTEFQALYSPVMREGLRTVLAQLGQEYQVPFIDARCWVDDAGFWDMHHLLPSGAVLFTERFAREALRPLVQPLLSPGPDPRRAA